MAKNNLKNIFSFNILTNLILIFALVHKNKSESYKSNKFNLSNEIKIIINGIGPQNILNPEYQTKPDQILVNGNPDNIDDENKLSNLQNGENTIIMKWNNKITDCSSMFQDLSNIIEIDLSQFDSSEVLTMYKMFNYNIIY